MGEQVRVTAASSTQRIMHRVQQGAADAPTCVVGVNEQQVHLTVLRVGGCVADDAAVLVGRNEQDVWRRMVRDHLSPVLGGEHGLLYKLAEVVPLGTHGRVEH